MKPICVCGPVYDLPLSPCSVPSHSLSLVRLLEIDLRVIRSVPLIAQSYTTSGAWRAASLSRRRRSRHPPGFAVLRPAPRSFDTGDGAMMPPAYQSSGDIDGGGRCPMSGVFYSDAVLFPLVRAVPSCSSLVRYEKRDGACRLPSSRCSR